jgi:hypothetical protein
LIALLFRTLLSASAQSANFKIPIDLPVPSEVKFVVGDQHEPHSACFLRVDHVVLLNTGRNAPIPGAMPRAMLCDGTLEGCTVKVRFRISL